MEDHYLLLKALHVIAFVSWMAGLLYLPRIFVYHCQVDKNSEAYDLFCTMEKRLLRYIMLPAMIATVILGMTLMKPSAAHTQGWFHAKLVLVGILLVSHHLMGRYRKAFLNKENKKSERYFRIFNEVPTLAMIGIVVLAVMKPF